MQTNNLHSYFADDSSLSIHAASGFTVAHITDGKVSVRGGDTLRPVELRHLADVAESFAAYHALAFAGMNYAQRLMPLVAPETI